MTTLQNELSALVLTGNTLYNLGRTEAQDETNGVLETMRQEIVALGAENDKLKHPVPFMWGMSYMAGSEPLDVEQRAGVKIQIRRFFISSSHVAPVLHAISQDIEAGRSVTQVSFKLPVTWSEAANGGADSWAQDAARQLAAAALGGTHRVQVAIHHEPEDDRAPNDGSTVAGRDAWVAMNARLGPIFRAAGLEYGVIVMGFHEMSVTTGNGVVWQLEKWLPALKGKIDFIGFDLYKATLGPAFRTKYLAYIQAQTEANDLEWGLSESAISPADFSANPEWFDIMAKLLPKYGASFFCYFNTSLNNGTNQLYMSPGDARENAYARVLRVAQATV